MEYRVALHLPYLRNESHQPPLLILLFRAFYYALAEQAFFLMICLCNEKR